MSIYQYLPRICLLGVGNAGSQLPVSQHTYLQHGCITVTRSPEPNPLGCLHWMPAVKRELLCFRIFPHEAFKTTRISENFQTNRDLSFQHKHLKSNFRNMVKKLWFSIYFRQLINAEKSFMSLDVWIHTRKTR